MKNIIVAAAGAAALGLAAPAMAQGLQVQPVTAYGNLGYSFVDAGPANLGAIHGRLITAWSMAAVLGPQLVNYTSTYQRDHGVPRAAAYDSTMNVMAGLLLLGLICNLMIRPVAARHHHHEPAPAGSHPVQV